MMNSGIRDWSCPACGSEVEWWYISDCSYNDSSGEKCKDCGKENFREEDKLNGLQKAIKKAKEI